jgi:hypothetical protein
MDEEEDTEEDDEEEIKGGKKAMKKSAEIPAELQAVMKAQSEQLELLQKQLKEEKNIRDLNDWQIKVEKNLSHFPGKSYSEMAKILKDLNDLNPTMAQTQFEQMKAASDALKSSEMFGASRSSNNRNSVVKVGGGSAWDQIETLTRDFVQKSNDIKLTHAAAMDEVLKSDKGKELYSQYLDENPAQLGR